MSHLIKIYSVCKFSYFHLWYLIQLFSSLELKINYYPFKCVLSIASGNVSLLNICKLITWNLNVFYT